MHKAILLLTALLPLAGAAWAEPLYLKDCLVRASADVRRTARTHVAHLEDVAMRTYTKSRKA